MLLAANARTGLGLWMADRSARPASLCLAEADRAWVPPTCSKVVVGLKGKDSAEVRPGVTRPLPSVVLQCSRLLGGFSPGPPPVWGVGAQGRAGGTCGGSELQWKDLHSGSLQGPSEADSNPQVLGCFLLQPRKAVYLGVKCSAGHLHVAVDAPHTLAVQMCGPV